MSMKSLIVGLLAASIACDPGQNMNKGDAEPVAGRQARAESPNVSAAPTMSAVPQKVTVLFFGTSLTAGYGLDPSIAFPNLVARMAADAGTPIVAINAGLSGETSAGAVRRIDWALKRPVDVVVVETGGNDALRALDPDSLKANIQQIVRRVRVAQPKARVLLAVMEAPPNLGVQYTKRFRNAYSEVAAEERVTLVPFLLDKVAGFSSLNQADGVHPNERGERVVAANVWRALEPVVRDVYSARGKG
ncbi:MAG TPA: arylesterase [Gemmatimonadaceae bacterium]|nr:arylesterase [Gemmatimonadaceae bacterium]